MIKYDVIGLAEKRRRHPFNAVYDTGEELFLGTCDSRGVGGVGVLVNTSLSMNIDSFEQLTTRIGRLRLKRCGSTPALTIFVVYAPTSNYDDEEVEAFYMDLERFYREDHTFFKVIIGDFNAKIGPRRSSEERHIGTHGLEWNEQVNYSYTILRHKINITNRLDAGTEMSTLRQQQLLMRAIKLLDVTLEVLSGVISRKSSYERGHRGSGGVLPLF
uniref:Endo/exonuclease/phosphatase domain-containing protein n=1 Tax=Angiostrongylus cantonensis TaxID=6313 RepID=A0A0K0DI34_ANGCA